MHQVQRKLFGNAPMYQLVYFRSILFFSLCLATTSDVVAQKTFEVTQEVRTCYASVLALNFNETRARLHQISVDDPDNLMAVYLEDFIDFFTLIISEDRKLYHVREDDQSRRLELLKKGPEESPWFRFTRAEVYLHRALLRIKFGEYFSAAADINRAFKLLKKNEEEFPDFAPTYKSIGILRMGVGTIPDKYMWAVKLFSSLEGTIKSGIENIERSIELGKAQNMLVLREAQYLYAQAIVHFESDPDKAWDYLNTLQLDASDNILECFMLANIAMRTGHNDHAIGLLLNKPSGSDIYNIPYMKLMLGRAYMFRSDENADVPLQDYVNTFEGENFIKEAYQKLAWYALLNDDIAGYQSMMDSCLKRGHAVMGEDKNAFIEASRGKIPNRALLKARLLFDGSYLVQALDELALIDQNDLDADGKLEYEYRKARVLHEMHKYDDAIHHYLTAIELGHDSSYYYACNAALQCGIIYEQDGHYEKAEVFFKKCLSMHPDDYQTSLHQKAKAGLSRLKSAD